MLLACPGLRRDKEFWSSASDEDYTYFSGFFEEARQKELTKMAYDDS